jgi:AAA ATPase domain
MDPAENPYTPSAGARPPVLSGRQEDLDGFDVVLTRLGRGTHARSVVYSGLRGVGKTVLLNELDVVAREKGWITSGVVECNEDDALPALVAKLAHRSLRRLSRVKRMSNRVQRAFGVLRAFTWTIDENPQWQLNIQTPALEGVADSGDREADIVELLGELGAAASDQSAGVAFLLDEMQFLGRDDLGLLAASFHRISQQTHPVVLAGAGLPQLPLMLLRAKPYAERLFTYKTIAGLSRPAAARALTAPAERANVSYDKPALDLVLDRSQGYPYFLQQWGEIVWNEADGPRIVEDDVLSAEDLVNDELDRRFFRDRYEKATEAERIYMAGMAALGDEPRTSADIAARMGKRQAAVSVRRDRLIKKGLIYNPVDTALDFTVPQFAAYMRRVHPFDPDERPRLGRRPKAD